MRIGPGLITGVADDDPSGIATYSQAGAQFGLNMLWTMPLAFPLMSAIQAVCARIGRVTGKGLAENIRASCPPSVLRSVILETVLVAEDEDSLRESIVAYLRQHGYTVLSACDGEEAIQVAREHDGPIHLLLTDVVMPRLEGGELAAELQRKRPGLATLFISGYTDQRLMTRLPDNPRPMVLQKPIKLRDLLNTIGEVMHPVN